MPSTDVSEGGLEASIVAALTGAAAYRASSTLILQRTPRPFTGPDNYIEERQGRLRPHIRA